MLIFWLHFYQILHVIKRNIMKERKDEQIIRELQSSNERIRDETLAYLYKKSQPLVKSFILKNKGNEQDVDDTFHDGMIAFYHLARKNKLAKDTNVSAYLYTICRNMWRKRLTKQPIHQSLQDTYDTIEANEIPMDLLLDRERKLLLEKVMLKLCDDCRKLLHLYYYEGLRMKEIVQETSLSNEQVVRNKKAGCMKKLRAIVMNSPIIKNTLISK